VSAWKLEWERAWGRPAGQGRIRRENADFEVAEALGWEPTGTGEHLLLYLEKDGDNTDYVARAVAELAGCRDYDVGYCGRKDRQAITRQWFSVPCPTEREQALIGRVSQRWRVQDQHRHERKLRRGQHEYNHFRIRVRSLDADQALLAERWRQVTEQGCPNYFGPQRFGWGGVTWTRQLSLIRTHCVTRARARFRHAAVRGPQLALQRMAGTANAGRGLAGGGGRGPGPRAIGSALWR